MLFYVGVDSGQLWCCWSSGTGNLLILQCSDFLNFSGGNSGFLPSCPRSRFCLKCSLKQVKQRFFSAFKDVHRKTSVPNFVQNVKNQRFVRFYTKESLLKSEYGSTVAQNVEVNWIIATTKINILCILGSCESKLHYCNHFQYSQNFGQFQCGWWFQFQCGWL